MNQNDMEELTARATHAEDEAETLSAELATVSVERDEARCEAASWKNVASDAAAATEETRDVLRATVQSRDEARVEVETWKARANSVRAMAVSELAPELARERDAALKSRDEAWARVASAEESERKAQAEVERLRALLPEHDVARVDVALADIRVSQAVKAEREACAQLAQRLYNDEFDGWSATAAAIRARKP